MVRVTDELVLSPEHLTLYHASDPLLGHLPVLILHGASTTANVTLNSSRVQIHIVCPAGFGSFPRITISPNSPFYSVVDHLPREFQGDEIYRALAFGLFKFFTELPDSVKSYLKHAFPTRGRRPGSGPAMFGEEHVADVVKSMVKSENTATVIAELDEALQTQHITNVDLDFILPPGAIIPLQPSDLEEVPDDEDDILDPTLRQYGGYTPLVKLFGEPVFLPTNKLRRAPSKPTSLNRSKSFSKDQKVELRMKLAELVDTEGRYVQKLAELVSQIAHDFRESAEKRQSDSLSPSEEELERLFPRSADKIFHINTLFLDELRRVMDETEDDAVRDMEAPTLNFASSRVGGASRAKDPSGALAMARLFLEWFPRFTQCYQDYIKASQHFPTLLNSFLDQQSSFRQRVNQRGEQAMRSVLIEPVQRLPRYSLLIDQIVASLPMVHPALQPMLRARDIITNICSMDDPLPDKPHVANRLRNMVEAWPMDLEPQGRLILATDFVEIPPPFQATVNQSDNSGVFLLFSDCIVILKKMGDKMSGKDLLREIDKPSAAELLVSMTNAAGGPASYEFVFTGWHSLCDVRFTESADGSLIWMTSTQNMKGAHTGEHKISKAATSRCFYLYDSYEAKSSKWSEDIIKARVEARFSEAEREDPCWTLRSVRLPDTNLGMHVAVFQEGADQLVSGRREPAPIRVVVDYEKGTKGAPVGHYGVEMVINVWSNDLRRVTMATVGLDGKEFQDEVALEDFLPTLSRRVIQLLSTQFNATNSHLAPAFISYFSKMLRGLTLSTRAEKTRSFLATSPVKLLSSLWSGGATPSNDTNSDQAVISGSKHQRQVSLHRTNSHHSLFGSIKGREPDDMPPENPLARLEQAFAAYTAVIQARKGTIIGRTLLNRDLADELSINDVYNKVIENPYDFDVAAAMDIGTEVIFVAFENFLRIAWAERMGPVITAQSLNTLLERANKRVPGDFADFVRYLFADMAPQNRRAFASLIRLLADLLEGSGNDSDRGALTLAFAELLVADAKAAPDYINLLDRLVEDVDRIFEDYSVNSSFTFDTPGSESMHYGKSHTGSMTSNASSLRRKFGLDMLMRQNTKEERPSVWRTLSRHRNPATGESSSFSKATMALARAADDHSLPKVMQRRPLSRDRPPTAGTYEDSQRPVSSHRTEFPLGTIGEPTNERIHAISAKKKRRSSLSDLKSLMAAASLDDEPLQPLPLAKQISGKFNASPKTTLASPSRIPISPKTAQPLKTTRQKENVADASAKNAPVGEDLFKSQESPTKGSSHSKILSISNIPTLKPSRPGNSGAESPTRPSSPTRPGNQKLRLQSPQKLRERLQTEKKAFEEVDASLKSELARIGEEMARVNSTTLASSGTVDLRRLGASVKALEDKIPTMMGELQRKQEALQKDMDTTLKASEAKVRSIDQLQKETTAENELLYERFNGELGKIVKALKGRGKEDKEELVTKLKEQGEETARVKKENARLKREMISLRAALRAAE